MKLRLSLLALCGLLMITASAWAGDPTGATTLAENPQSPVDYVWVLVCGFLVFFMQAGFAMVEAGFCRAKNATNLMAKNGLDFAMASLAFFVVGYGLMMGDDAGGLFGTSGFFLKGDNYDVGNYLSFFWQLMFAGTAATIVSGAVAERLKFKAYFAYSLLLTALIYPIYGHWVWGGGWLSSIPFGLGHIDFAGSGVVHAIGGFVGLAGAIVLGPRFGKFGKDGKPKALPGHSITLAALGTFILWFGWFGFNPGSTFSAHELRIAVIAVNTNLAAAAGAIAAILIVYAKTGKWDVGMMLNGALAGLVAITAPCAWVEAWAAVVIGLIGGALVVAGVYFWEALGVDDPVGAVSVHGINGIWGLLAVGLFADGTYGNYTTEAPLVTGLFYGGGWGQFIAQAIGAFVCVAWAFGLGFLLFKTLDSVMGGIRVSPGEELKGHDIQEHGTPAYPNFYTYSA
ncbi:MAG: ammonium transporter [Candidatus Omnitrophica bacterium]|nr:ammonium transporter [Candidatus Omnitrophota bacterium]